MTIAEDLGFDVERLHRLDAVLHRYVDDGRLPGVQTLISRRGQLVHRDRYGWTDVEAGAEVRDDTLYRIFSMTKPITSVALMMLFEEGHFLLEDPISTWLPDFAAMEVWTGGTADAPETAPSATPITVRHVLTHTSGLTYGFQYAHPVDELYRRQGLGDFAQTPDYDTTEAMRRVASLPLQFEPGTRWNYSMSTDVCGALVERMSGLTLDEFFRTRILEPLGMTDTGFAAPESEVERCSALYARLPGWDTKMRIAEPRGMTKPPTYLDGGGGLVSTADDYLRFCHLLVGRGAVDGVRLLSPRTLAFMASNHLPGGRTLNEMGQATFSEAAMEGTGFGLGFSVLVDPAASGTLGSPGTYAWGGAASTAFWVDPVEELAVVFMTQLLPSNLYPLRRNLAAGVYQALVD
ncbi:serine hydrolase domain-containing protein [Aquihabitans sp. McL0605]|uniref:serine hydrolase domain-containing protein n=1 Tax=Aquihabitans sp. McL0605 TaxID=3415671 RepID=UPI003CED984B